MANRARIEANQRYAKKAYEQIKFSSRKENRLSELIEYAASAKRMSKAAYIAEAISEALKRDGIEIDILPEIVEESQKMSDFRKSDVYL